jgi:hypothetical protein
MKNKLFSLSRLKQAILAVTLSSAVASTGLQADTVWADDFTGAALNTNLTAYNNGGGAGSTQSVGSGGQLTMDTGVVGGSAQAALNTATDSTGAVSTFNGEKLYNFYDHEVSASFDIASIAAGTPGTGRNVFYFSIGDDAAGNFMPQNNVLDDGIGFAMEQVAAGWRLYYQAFVGQAASGGVAALLSGVPTSITYTLDGALATIDITGATFTNQGGAGLIIDTNTVTVALSDVSANISGYNLAFGAYNQGTVTDKTVVTLNSFDVAVIPEPGTYALLAGCSALTSVMVRRRR